VARGTRGTDLGGSGRKGLTGAGGSTAVQTERRGAHGISAELGALTVCSERGRSGGPRWLNDDKHRGSVASKRRRRKKGRSTRGGGLLLL
jgi:hypothetical protein